MVEYTLLALMAVAATVLAELLWLRTGIFRMRAYWLTIAISVAFMPRSATCRHIRRRKRAITIKPVISQKKLAPAATR